MPQHDPFLEPVATADVPDAGFELKFTVDAWNAMAIRHWLQSICRPDPIFPHGIVNSIYFDTPSMRHLREKIESDYLKTKVRLRWYEDGNQPPTVAFLEAKFRIGSRRRKVRVEMPFDEAWRRGAVLDDQRLRPIPERLRERGVIVPAALRPILLVRYQRDRFVDHITGTRISLDTDISVPAFSRNLFGAANPLALPTSVLEVKGSVADVPDLLRHVANVGGRKTSFSKYLACYDQARNVYGR